MFPVTSDFNHMHVSHSQLVFVETDLGYEACNCICMLVHTAHHMRQSYKMVPDNPNWEDKIL